MKRVSYLVELGKANGMERKSGYGKLGVIQTYEINDKLDNYSDIVNDSMKLVGETVQVVIDEANTPNEDKEKRKKELQKLGDTINFEVDKKGEISFKSPYTKRMLEKHKPCVLAIGVNKAGERLNCIIRKSNGELATCKYNTLISGIKKGGSLANMFLRDEALTLTKGNEKMPIIEIGQKLENNVKEEKVSSKTNEDVEVKDIISVMRKKGYGKLVDKFGLTNPAYPRKTLVFYFNMFEAGKENIVANMLTTDSLSMAQLREIALGIENGVNVKEYGMSSVDEDEMKVVRVGLEKGYWKKSMIPVNKTLKKMIKKRASGKGDEKLESQIGQAKDMIQKSRK